MCTIRPHYLTLSNLQVYALEKSTCLSSPRWCSFPSQSLISSCPLCCSTNICFLIMALWLWCLSSCYYQPSKPLLTPLIMAQMTLWLVMDLVFPLLTQVPLISLLLLNLLCCLICFVFLVWNRTPSLSLNCVPLTMFPLSSFPLSFIVKDLRIRTTLLHGPTKGSVYAWPTHVSSRPPLLTFSNVEASFSDWHNRLGHPSNKILS